MKKKYKCGICDKKMKHDIGMCDKCSVQVQIIHELIKDKAWGLAKHIYRDQLWNKRILKKNEEHRKS